MINTLPDVQQNKGGFHKTPIDKVGVRNIQVPFLVKRKDGSFSHTVATCSSYCDLGPDVKGINMSRISRVINNILSQKKNGFDNLKQFVKQLQQFHQATETWIKANFIYFIEQYSPIEHIQCFEPIDVTFESHLKNSIYKDFLTVKTKQMSLCPCSKEMSLLKNNLTDEEYDQLHQANISENLYHKILEAGFGAHNQKSEIEITVDVNLNNKIWIEDLVEISKKASSCSTYSVLKRGDEKYVTEASYMGKFIDFKGNFVQTEQNDGPKFVEDIARDCAYYLDKHLDKQINDYIIIVNNEESIHSQDIYATAVKTAGRQLI